MVKKLGAAIKKEQEVYTKALLVGFRPMLDAMKEASKDAANKTMKNLGKALANNKALKLGTRFFQEMQLIGKMAMAPFNAMMSIMDMFGVAQPILDLISGVVSIIGGGILNEMSDEIADFAEVLFSPEMITIWEDIGTAIGKFLGIILETITLLFKNPLFRNALKNLISVF